MKPATRLVQATFRLVREPSRTAFLLAIFLVYLALFFYAQMFQSPPIKDEGHFWESALHFSGEFPPTLEQLRSYTEIITPFSFILWGQLARLLRDGLFVGRFLNLLLSFAILCLIGLRLRGRDSYAMLAAVCVLANPYYLAMSAHLYTDIPAAFFTLLGCRAFARRRTAWASLFLAVAISFRQYMVAFPLALAVSGLVPSPRGEGRRWRDALWMVAAACMLIFWFFVFGGIGPKPGVDEWVPRYPAPMLDLLSVIPEYGLYLLSCLGVYFVVPELVFFRRRFRPRGLVTRGNALVAVALLLLFVLYPPYFPDEGPQGMFGRLVRFALPESPLVRLSLYYLLALATCLRFRHLDVGFWIITVHVLMMLKVQLAWEKYTLPVLVVLWYLKSLRALDGGPFPPQNGSREPPRPEPLEAVRR